MNYNEFDERFTSSGDLTLQEDEIGILQELVNAGDRGAFHFLYGEMANCADSRLTAQRFRPSVIRQVGLLLHET